MPHHRHYPPPIRNIVVAQSVSYLAWTCAVLAWIADSVVCTSRSRTGNTSPLNNDRNEKSCVQLTFHHDDNTTAKTLASIFALLATVIGCLVATLLLCYPAVPNFLHKNSTNRWRGGVGGCCLLCAVCMILVLMMIDLDTNSSVTYTCTGEIANTRCSPTSSTSFATGAYCIVAAIVLWTVACCLVCIISPKMNMRRRRNGVNNNDDDEETVATNEDEDDDDENDRIDMDLDESNTTSTMRMLSTEIETGSPIPTSTTESPTPPPPISQDQHVSSSSTQEQEQDTVVVPYCCCCQRLQCASPRSPQQVARLLYSISFLFYLLLHLGGSTTLLTLSNKHVSDLVNLLGGLWLLTMVPYHAYGARYYKYLVEETDEPLQKSNRLLQLNVYLQVGLWTIGGIVLGVYYGVVET